MYSNSVHRKLFTCFFEIKPNSDKKEKSIQWNNLINQNESFEIYECTGCV